MPSLPQLKQLKTTKSLQKFASKYLISSSLPIPESYLYNTSNKVFGIYWKKQLIGGFILGNGEDFRTVSLFSLPEKHASIYQENMESKMLYTEICCFWIQRKFRTKTWLNIFTWLAMTYTLKRYGNKFFLFGTCSRSLARLYSQTNKSILIHQDFINKKPTFIFQAKRSSCISGMLEIIRYKLKRRLKILKTTKSLINT